jgi:uncharacterized membrane protein
MVDEQSSQPAATAEEVVAAPQPITATADDNNSTLMGILCYLGILVIIPYLVAKENTFVNFHIKQGVVISAIWIVLYIAREMIIPWRLWGIVGVLNLGLLVLSIIGIVYVLQKKEKELPLVGSLAKYVKI